MTDLFIRRLWPKMLPALMSRHYNEVFSFFLSGKGRKFRRQHNVSPLQANSEDLAQVQQCVEQKTCVAPQETILNDSCVSFSHLYFIQQGFAEQARSLCITCLVKTTFVYCCVGGLSILLKGTPDSQC